MNMHQAERLPVHQGPAAWNAILPARPPSVPLEGDVKVDVAIVSRYHNLLCSLKTGRPTFSLGYAQKNDELMAEFGRGAFCQHIENFDVAVLIRQVRDALADLDGAREAIERHNASIRQALARQEELLLSDLLQERPIRHRTTVRT